MTQTALNGISRNIISIHTALAGCDVGTPLNFVSWPHISIHTALAGCDPFLFLLSLTHKISIHTALAGCDPYCFLYVTNLMGFQSTQPSQAVTLMSCNIPVEVIISIHTALAGCDLDAISQLSVLDNFNPHSPRRL